MTTADDSAVRRVLEAAGVEFIDANGGVPALDSVPTSPDGVERVAGATRAQPDRNAESQNRFGDSPPRPADPIAGFQFLTSRHHRRYVLMYADDPDTR
jgi:hypothetical protein